MNVRKLASGLLLAAVLGVTGCFHHTDKCCPPPTHPCCPPPSGGALPPGTGAAPGPPPVQYYYGR
jgi:hypothetical protein